MVVLRKKLIREIKANLGVYLACIVVIMIGLLTYTSMSIAVENLERAQNHFYAETHFADGFIKVNGYPEGKVTNLANLEGIDRVEGRIVKDARLFSEETEGNRYLRLVSMNFTNGPDLNQAQLFSGQWPEEGKMEILVDPKFIAANSLALGDTLTLILEGKRSSFTVVGTAQSPEFIYAMRSAQELYPDPATFGIAYVPQSSLSAIVKEAGQVNDIAFTLEPGASFEDSKLLLEKSLKPYGLQSIFPRKDQTSHAILESELSSLRSTAKALPLVFLAVASIILYTMLRRLIEQQRMNIGNLKAFGFTNREIILHYLSYPLFIGGVGGLLGGLAGIALSFPLITLYEEFFALPGLESHFSWKYLFLGLALSLVFSLLSGLKSSLDILRLEPAEAMRPAAPRDSGKTPIERFTWLWNNLTSQSQMGIRNVFRSPMRSIFTVVGMAVIFSLMAVSWSMDNMIDKLTTFQFQQVQTYDVKVSLNRPESSRSLQYALAHEPGVTHLEPLLEIPATLQNQWYKKEVAVLGINQDSTLYNVLNQKGEKVPIPQDGILLSERLARLLQVQVGDAIQVESPLRRQINSDQKEQLIVRGVIPQYVGLNAFMEIGALADLLQQGDIATSMLIQMDAQEVSALKSRYRDAERVGNIESSQESAAKIEELMGSYGFTIYFLAVIAGFAGFALIYNSSIISLSERQRELASLRVLGLTAKEALQVITSEQWLLTLFGVLLGIPLSFGLLEAMAQSMSTDLYSIPTEIPPSALLGAVMGTAISVWIAQTRTYNKIKKLPFVEVLATKE
ncbi:ABC-type transport system, involved in lipoprotein release, permease component [Desulfitobacterium dichloroeliminans LMG P-21439]|uniref:ABC-type transport system, involved in lipoprotein release, permease component n=1 Tax=Desulfitobacterium dichloroeliminans (strain LMG P-21439 / DCA1) TaxID=871963 RepID=L0FCR6_DESDL|nr:FtsX-like permease family protein [Desulfitobacterium dichloroeliminans]AGA70743.1 ABC-type transport system, involved in lipoprotein release, permease component [Desulfitobacterium dichloroeliminans LMG P-21439]